jgi:hypothetical protein
MSSGRTVNKGGERSGEVRRGVKRGMEGQGEMNRNNKGRRRVVRIVN